MNKIKSHSISYLFFYMLFVLCKFNGHAQLILNDNIEETTTIPFQLQRDRICLQIQLFDENFNVFLDNGAPKTNFPSKLIEKFFTLLPDSLLCQTFPKIPDLKDYEISMSFKIKTHQAK